MHITSLQFIKTELNERKHYRSVVITHHAPSEKSIYEEYQASELSPGYASNIEQDIINMKHSPYYEGMVIHVIVMITLLEVQECFLTREFTHHLIKMRTSPLIFNYWKQHLCNMHPILDELYRN